MLCVDCCETSNALSHLKTKETTELVVEEPSSCYFLAQSSYCHQNMRYSVQTPCKHGYPQHPDPEIKLTTNMYAV